MEQEKLRAQGERELAERLRAEREVQKAIEKAEELGKKGGARRHLLANALRLTREMAPDVTEIMTETAAALEIDAPMELYVYPSPMFNAAAVKPEEGRLFVIFSSSLLEAFGPGELRFVAGHELGHHLFGHHEIPVGLLLHPSSRIRPGLALQLFAWQRYAEVSCDRAGLHAAGGLHPAAAALFKLASGIGSDRVKVRIDEFIKQLGDLRAEATRLERVDAPARSDWFSSHPFSPLRLRCAELFAGSELVTEGGTPIDEVEAEIHELMTLMDPSYLKAKTDVAEVMRRLVFAGGVLIATAGDRVGEPELKAIEELLGPGAVPSELDPDAVREALPRWVERARAQVPRLRRVQVIRDLCLVAGADGEVSEAERAVIEEIASAVEVDVAHIEDFIEDQKGRPLD